MLVSPSDVVAKAKATIKECTVSQVKDCLGADTLMIDIREPENKDIILYCGIVAWAEAEMPLEAPTV
jgi:hypothetical protein